MAKENDNEDDLLDDFIEAALDDFEESAHINVDSHASTTLLEFNRGEVETSLENIEVNNDNSESTRFDVDASSDSLSGRSNPAHLSLASFLGEGVPASPAQCGGNNFNETADSFMEVFEQAEEGNHSPSSAAISSFLGQGGIPSSSDQFKSMNETADSFMEVFEQAEEGNHSPSSAAISSFLGQGGIPSSSAQFKSMNETADSFMEEYTKVEERVNKGGNNSASSSTGTSPPTSVRQFFAGSSPTKDKSNPGPFDTLGQGSTDTFAEYYEKVRQYEEGEGGDYLESPLNTPKDVTNFLGSSLSPQLPEDREGGEGGVVLSIPDNHASKSNSFLDDFDQAEEDEASLHEELSREEGDTSQNSIHSYEEEVNIDNDVEFDKDSISNSSNNEFLKLGSKHEDSHAVLKKYIKDEERDRGKPINSETPVRVEDEEIPAEKHQLLNEETISASGQQQKSSTDLNQISQSSRRQNQNPASKPSNNGQGHSHKKAGSRAHLNSSSVVGTASMDIMRNDFEVMSRVDMSSIIALLDKLKEGWGIRFAPAFAAVGLEDLHDLEDATPVELEELERELKLRGARLRHLRIISAAVLDRRFKQELDNEMSHEEDIYFDNKDELTKSEQSPHVINLPSAAIETRGTRDEKAMFENKMKMYQVVKEADTFFQDIEEGNTKALVSLYAGLGGVNWIVRTGWRGEKVKTNGTAASKSSNKNQSGKTSGMVDKLDKSAMTVKSTHTSSPKSGGGATSASEGARNMSTNNVALHGVTLGEVVVVTSNRSNNGRDGKEEGEVRKKVKRSQVVALDLKFNGLAGKLCGSGETVNSPSPSRPATSYHSTAIEKQKDLPVLADRNLISPIHGNHDSNMQLGENMYEPISQNNNAFRDMLNMPALRSLNLSGNSLSGVLPSGPLAALIRLEVLNLSQNRLTGELPEGGGSLSCLTRLKTLSLRHNILKGHLEGRLPVSLEHLNLSNNRFSGRLPREMFHMNGLKTLLLNDNKLTGTISRLPINIEVAVLNNNRFSGDLGRLRIVGLKNLRRLRLDHNQFTPEMMFKTEERLVAESRYGDGVSPLPQNDKRSKAVPVPEFTEPEFANKFALPTSNAQKESYQCSKSKAAVMMETIGQLIRMNESMARKTDMEYNEIKEIVRNNNRDKHNNRLPPGSDLYHLYSSLQHKEAEIKQTNVSAHSDDGSQGGHQGVAHNKHRCQGAHPITGWCGGCPNAEIVIVGVENVDAYKQMHSQAVKHATRLVPTTTMVKSTLIDARNQDSPYTVVWLEGLKEFRSASSLTKDRFRPRPPAPFTSKTATSNKN